MPCVNYKPLLESYQQLGARKADSLLRQTLKDGAIRPSDFDFGRLFEACYGIRAWRKCKSKDWLATDVMAGKKVTGSREGAVLEAAGAVTTAAFQNISGQIVYSALMEKYELEEFVFSKLIPTVKTEFDGEKIAGLVRLGDEAQVIPENEPYPLASIGENFIETPRTKKRGFTVPITREAIFFDRTGKVLEFAGEVGEFLGLNKEKRAINCVIDENAGAVSALAGGHRYHWRGTSYTTYVDSPWDNLAGTNTLLDWNDVQDALLLLRAMKDPDTGEFTNFTAKHLVVTPQLEWTARRIVSATEIRVATPGYATTGNPTQTLAPNPVPGLQIVSSQLLAGQMATDTSWYLGDIAKAFRYMENWPMEVKQAPPNNMWEFERDIVAAFRCGERGAYATFEPRAIVKSTVA